jgi:hypothetical protein
MIIKGARTSTILDNDFRQTLDLKNRNFKAHSAATAFSAWLSDKDAKCVVLAPKYSSKGPDDKRIAGASCRELY